jgi:DNA-binding IclR family transcriptional regulator
MPPVSRTYSVQSVDKALELLDVIADESVSPSLNHLSERLGLSSNRTLRILSTLVNRGMLERDLQTGCYQLGIHSIEMAQKFMNSLNVLKHARPVMATLGRIHEEAIYMTVMKGNDVFFLDMVDTEQRVKTSSLIGQKFPFFSNAAGKVMVAFESQDLLEKYFKKNRKSRSLVNAEGLEQELTAIRKRGVAIDIGGLGEGITCVAVAVKDYAGKVVGALTMLAPSFRMLQERLEKEIIPSMVEGAEVLSMKFGNAG